MKKSSDCPYCHDKMRITRYRCDSCEISIEGHFSSSALSRLSDTHQQFIELFVLSSGSLKQMAQNLGITYPTVRNRLDEVIGSLKAQMKASEDNKDEILEKVEKGELSPEAAAEILKDL
ncbi:MAG: DUF2089 domain-containing protein [Desulfobacteraceae bacterium]|nr:MAG: DUF2089 domain-containing protein [Desulfobacteraceae bacterium]